MSIEGEPGLVETVETSARIVTEGGEPIAVMADIPPDIEGGESGGEMSEVIAVAAIEAEAEVRIEEIHSETAIELAREETAREEVRAEREELSWQQEASELRTSMQELTNRMEMVLSSVQALTPQPSTAAPEIPAEILDPEAVTNSTSEFTSEETSETPTAVILESGGESQELLAVPARRKRRLI